MGTYIPPEATVKNDFSLQNFLGLAGSKENELPDLGEIGGGLGGIIG